MAFRMKKARVAGNASAADGGRRRDFAMNDTIGTDTPEKDVPLRYDIRLLGRILGDTVRQQEGEAVFDLVERIRRTGVQFHRNADETARAELQALMSGLPTDQANRIIRAFGYFSHLSNIAEDQHHIRRTRAPAGAVSARLPS